MDHILLRRAKLFQPSEPSLPDGWTYRKDICAWVDADAPDILMTTGLRLATPSQPAKPPVPPLPRPSRQPGPRRPLPKAPPEQKPLPMTKKADMETGEDMKGT